MTNDFMSECCFTGKEPDIETSKMTLPVDVYRNMSRYQAKFLEMVSSSKPDKDFSSSQLKAVDNFTIASRVDLNIELGSCTSVSGFWPEFIPKHW